jgi:hypothetical protein
LPGFSLTKVWCRILKVLNDVVEADVGPNHASEQPDAKDDRIFGEPSLEALRVVPVGGQVDHGRRHDGEGGHLDGAQQGYEKVQPGDCCGKSN